MQGAHRSVKFARSVAGLITATVCLAGPWAAAQADTNAYVTFGGGNFGTLDLNTGAFTDLGTSGSSVAGLGDNNGTLYTTSYKSSAGNLYTVNTGTGVLTLVGSSGVDYYDFGSTTGGLYALDTSLNLYSINPGTGAATLLGATGLSASCYCGLSSNGSTLYFSNGSNLYTLSTVNGAATSVGSTGGATFGGLLSESSTTLYGGLTSVSTLSTTNGAASAGVTITGTGAGTVFGLAADPLTISAVPEPATYALMLAGLGLMGVVVRRREAKP